MKKIIMGLLFISISTASFSQQTKPSPALTQQDYIRKGRNNNTFGWTLLISGALSTIIGTVHFNFYGQEKQTGLNSGYFYGGLIAMGASIPFFIVGSHFKKKAMEISFRSQPLHQLSKQTFVYKSIPSLSLKIDL